MVCAETAVAGCQADRPICLAPLGEPPRDSRAVAILKVCLNCGRPFPPSELRTGRCHGCIKQHDAERNARPERRVWRTARWQRIRATALERDGHACADCHASNLRLDAHHITALRDGGEPFALEPRMKPLRLRKRWFARLAGPRLFGGVAVAVRDGIARAVHRLVMLRRRLECGVPGIRRRCTSTTGRG